MNKVEDILTLKFLCHHQEYGALLLAIPAVTLQYGTTAMQVVIDECGYLFILLGLRPIEVLIRETNNLISKFETDIFILARDFKT